MMGTDPATSVVNEWGRAHDVGDPAGELRRIETADADGWGVLTTVAAGAYFLNPAISEAVGYPLRRALVHPIR